MGTKLPDISMKVTGETRMEHVLSANGRLLRATVARDVVVEATFGAEPVGPRHFVRHTDVRLVSACDGPTEARRPITLTREEKAIEAVGELGVAVYKDDRDKAIARFSPALRKKHGDGKLWDVIQRYRQAQGSAAWPVPVLVEDANVVVLDAQRVEVSASRNVPKPGSANTVTPVALKFVVRADGATSLPVVERITGAFTIEKGEVFEASDRRLYP